MHSPAHYLPGAVVEYRAPSGSGSQWVATIKRGTARADRFRAAVPYAAGPDAAAAAVVDRFNAAMGAHWRVHGAALSLDGGNRYAYAVGPDYVAPIAGDA